MAQLGLCPVIVGILQEILEGLGMADTVVKFIKDILIIHHHHAVTFGLIQFFDADAAFRAYHIPSGDNHEIGLIVWVFEV